MTTDEAAIEAMARADLTPLTEFLDEFDRHPEVAAHLPAALAALREMEGRDG